MKGALLVCKKEFLDLSKDKRTLFFTFLLPILLYPAVFLVIAGMSRSDSEKRMGRPSRVLVVDPSQVLEPALRKNSATFEITVQPVSDVKQALRDDKLDLAVEVDASAAGMLERQETYPIHVVVDETEPSSELALHRLRDAISKLDKERVTQRLEALHAPPQLTQPSSVITENAASAGQGMGKALGAFLPYVLMLMMFQGAMQHGIHVTAGEKERGTLLSLLATPLPRNQIIWGKLIYIFAMGLLAALLNLISMGISLAVVMGNTSGAAGSRADIAGDLSAAASPGTLPLCFLLLAPLGLLFASFILYMGIRARNAAEAGTSLMPGFFLIITLGAFSLAPGIERMTLLPYVPILNVSLAIRKLFSKQGSVPEYLIALAMTTGLAILMTWVSARLLDKESAIFRQS